MNEFTIKSLSVFEIWYVNFQLLELWPNQYKWKRQIKTFVANVSHKCKLTILRTCCEKLWLMNVASSARFFGEFRLAPSSCGGSVAVSLTVNKSTYIFTTS